MRHHRWIGLEELQERRDQWRELAADGGFPTVYGDPAWLLPWWATYGERLTPWCLALEDDGKLCGLALLALSDSGPARTLGFMGTPWNGLDCLLYAHDAEEQLTDCLLSALAERSRDWELWKIRRLPMHTRLAERLLAGDGPLHSAAHDLRLQPYLELPSEEATFEAGFPAKQRQRQRRRWRRLLDAGLSPHLVSDPPEIAAAMHSLIEMRRGRAEKAGQHQANLDEQFERFAIAAVQELSPDGARLWTLRDADGSYVAICLNLVEGPREHGYMIAITDRCAEHRPGHSLKHHALLSAIAEGRRELDLGPGRDPSKYSLGAVDRRLTRVVIASRSWRGRIAGSIAGADLRVRDTRLAHRLRDRRGVTSERA